MDLYQYSKDKYQYTKYHLSYIVEIINHLTHLIFLQQISYNNCKASIPIIFVLFVKNIYLLLENISTLMEKTILKDNEILIKTSFV